MTSPTPHPAKDTKAKTPPACAAQPPYVARPALYLHRLGGDLSPPESRSHRHSCAKDGLITGF